MIVLIGIDDSPHARGVLDTVKGSAWPKDARFHVVSVSAPVFLDPEKIAAPEVIARVIEKQEQYHKELADQAAAELRSAGFTTESRMISGDPRSALVEEARRLEASLLVVGSRGRSGLSRLLLGSVASHVVAHAPCSVLVVK